MHPRITLSYNAKDFDDDFRTALLRSGCENESLCFMLDENDILESSFLERINNLLANGEVPGLFEGNDYRAFLDACRSGVQREGLLIDQPDELYNWFTANVIRNFHVVFTMDLPTGDLADKAAASPALFNRCVLNWMGNWTDEALLQVALSLLQGITLDPQTSDVDIDTAALSNMVAQISVSIHRLAEEGAKLLSKQPISLPPRQFVDFARQFAQLHDQGRDRLEDQQRHFNSGIEKLESTLEEIASLQIELTEKQKLLSFKQADANDKLQQMVADQKEAESTRFSSLDLQKDLSKQESEIRSRKAVVLDDLAKVEPVVEEARNSVSNIKKQHLSEVRSMSNPPEGVQLALESVCALLGYKTDSWRTIQAIIRRDDFISNIVNFDSELRMNQNLRALMERHYLNNAQYTFDTVNRASKACGPLVQWVIAQVNFSAILDKVKPLREEVNELEHKAETTRLNAMNMGNLINGLETKIQLYKSEYAALVSEAQLLKLEAQTVEEKLFKSVELLESLKSEEDRWRQERAKFETNMSVLCGDSLLAAAFVEYCGPLDQSARSSILESWRTLLEEKRLEYTKSSSVSDHLISSEERQRWVKQSLPDDDLWVENAVILSRSRRYPLFIDPSDRIRGYLEKSSSPQRLIVTSFLSHDFLKATENAIRFGYPLLIEDADHIQPVVFPLLREYRNEAGRILTSLGKQDIDVAPGFKLYLSTRSPSAYFPPFLTSKLSVIGFTVTKNSLRSQCLMEALKHDRPDLETRRSQIYEAHTILTLRLRELEKELLESLYKSEGKILDNNAVMSTLAKLKSEAQEINQKVADTDNLMAEINENTAAYQGLADAAAAIFSILESLSAVNHWYRFSLSQFLGIFDAALHESGTIDKPGTERSSMLVHRLCSMTIQKVGPSLHKDDRLLLALKILSIMDLKKQTLPLAHIAKCFLQSDCSIESQSKELDYNRGPKIPKSFVHAYTVIDGNDLDRLMYLASSQKSRLIHALESYVLDAFQLSELSDDIELNRLVSEDKPVSDLIALCAQPGNDVSHRVEELAQLNLTIYKPIAMGSSEGTLTAEATIIQAARKGWWVLLHNFHLCLNWLPSLNQLLRRLVMHKKFRVFITLELSRQLPVDLLIESRIFIFDSAFGLRTTLRETLKPIMSKYTREPTEKSRVLLALVWLHAVIKERHRYIPNSWSKRYDIGYADLETASFVANNWLEVSARGRSHIAPEEIPWEALNLFIGSCVYGGHLDISIDYDKLQRLCQSFLNVHLFDDDFEFAPGLKGPEFSSEESMISWINNLPDHEPASWLGLPAHSDSELLIDQGKWPFTSESANIYKPEDSLINLKC